MADPEFPSVPREKLSAWELAEESVETVFQMPAARVVGATRRYEDEQTRDSVRDATDGQIDHEWRFFAATRLAFDPMLPPGTLPSMILPTVRTQAKKTFRERLERRGVTDVERGRRERLRVRAGKRARVIQFDGVDPVDSEAESAFVPASGVPVTGWVGVWNDGSDFYVVTGGYPAQPLGDVVDVAVDDTLGPPPEAARSTFFDLLRDVE